MITEIKINSCTPSCYIDRNLAENKAYLGISIFNDFHTSKLVEQQIGWMNENFKVYKILIGDYLYRHNREILSTMNKKDYLLKCMSRGTEVANNYIKCGAKSEDIIFWKDVIKSKDFLNEYKLLQKDFENNLLLQKSIINSCDFFLKTRKSINKSNLTYNKLLTSCINFIIEELAVMSLMILRGYTTQVYLGVGLNILKEISSGQIHSSSSLHKGIFIDLSIEK